MSRLADALLAAVENPGTRYLVWHKAREILPKNPARCATTLALFAINARIMQRWRGEWKATGKILAAFKKKGWKVCRDLSKLQPGYPCASENHNTNPDPDHVYIFVGWLDYAKGIAEIMDNQKRDPHARNIKRGVKYLGIWYSKTPIDYFLIPPE
jgi:hypothetical protein